MGIYNISGQNQESVNDVYIKNVRNENPSFNDDQLLEKAMKIAKQNGKTSKIIWDGSDIHFSGSVEHVCNGFGGIDFSGSKIYMPNVDNKNILIIQSDVFVDITIDASSFFEYYTIDSRLKNKIFTMNNGHQDTDNADMCLGYRFSNHSNSLMYSAPVVFADDDGYYKTGKLFLTPENGTVPCYNVHDYPIVTFDVCNGIIISSNTQNMSTFIWCSRSNTHLHNFVLEGKSDVRQYHNGIFIMANCADIEVDHISGINPIEKSKTSGYFLGLFDISFAHVHDVYVGDTTSWGCIGGAHLTNVVFERCHLNRWDCHYAQYGYNKISNCVLNTLGYGTGYGQLVIENCIFESNSSPIIYERSDIPAVFDGNIVIRDSVIDYTGNQQGTAIFGDYLTYKKEEYCKVPSSPKGYRIISNCIINGNIENVIETGSESTDYDEHENISYAMEYMNIPDVSEIISANTPSSQKCKKIIISKCDMSENQDITDIANIITVVDNN